MAWPVAPIVTSAIGMEQGIPAEQDRDCADHGFLLIIENRRCHHDDVGAERRVEGDLAHVGLRTGPLDDRLPPGGLAVEIFHLGDRTDDQGTLLIRDQYPDVVRLTDVVPADQIVGHDAVDEKRKLAALVPLLPALLPILNHLLDGLRILPFVGPVGFRDGGTQERRGGQLLSLVHDARHVHFDPARGIDRDLFEIGAGRLAQGASFFEVGEGEEKGQRQKSDHHDCRDDLALETVRPTPEGHGHVRL